MQVIQSLKVRVCVGSHCYLCLSVDGMMGSVRDHLLRYMESRVIAIGYDDNAKALL